MIDLPYGLPAAQQLSTMTPKALAKLISETLDAAKEWLEVAVKGDPELLTDFRIWAGQLVAVVDHSDAPTVVALDAREIMRRAERALGLAIRRGQAEGTIRRAGRRRHGSAPGPGDIVKVIQSSQLTHLYRLSDISRERFEEALAEARRTGYMSQEGLRKILDGGSTAEERGRRIAELAAQRCTSRQIAAELGVRVSTVIEIASELGITISGRPRRVDPEPIVRETVTALEGLAIGLRLLERQDYESLNPSFVESWLQSLTVCLPEISTLQKELRRAHYHH